MRKGLKFKYKYSYMCTYCTYVQVPMYEFVHIMHSVSESIINLMIGYKLKQHYMECVHTLWIRTCIIIINFVRNDNCLFCKMYTCVFLISLYGTPLAQRASCLALHSSLFEPDAQLIMITLALIVNWLKMYCQWHTH